MLKNVQYKKIQDAWKKKSYNNKCGMNKKRTSKNIYIYTLCEENESQVHKAVTPQAGQDVFLPWLTFGWLEVLEQYVFVSPQGSRLLWYAHLELNMAIRLKSPQGLCRPVGLGISGFPVGCRGSDKGSRMGWSHGINGFICDPETLRKHFRPSCLSTVKNPPVYGGRRTTLYTVGSKIVPFPAWFNFRWTRSPKLMVSVCCGPPLSCTSWSSCSLP